MSRGSAGNEDMHLLQAVPLRRCSATAARTCIPKHQAPSAAGNQSAQQGQQALHKGHAVLCRGLLACPGISVCRQSARVIREF